jgi:hypothetical protein
MVEYMNDASKCDNIKKWREHLVHKDTSENRDAFWYKVTKVALSKLREDNGRLQREWMDKSQQTRTNGMIEADLTELLKPSIIAFFKHRVTNDCLAVCKKPLSTLPGSDPMDLPFLFIIDEAAYLNHQMYMHSFMWVLDVPVTLILSQLRGNPDIPGTNRFFVMMLGTHSEISHFAPHPVFPSERYYTRTQRLPAPFISLSWDQNLTSLRTNGTIEDCAIDTFDHIDHLVRWGRPAWMALRNGLHSAAYTGTVIENAKHLEACLTFAKEKLMPMDRSYEELVLSIFACLSIRLHLDLDFASASRASKLVCSKLRWLVDVDSERKHITTTYGSEPLVVEAAACLMNSFEQFERFNREHKCSPVQEYLYCLEESLNQSYVDRGAHGELTTRLLRTSLILEIVDCVVILAKDKATHNVWRKDPRTAPLNHLRPSIDYYERLHSPHAFYHRAVRVEGNNYTMN